jgi:hypothetical protein
MLSRLTKLHEPDAVPPVKTERAAGAGAGEHGKCKLQVRRRRAHWVLPGLILTAELK